MIIVAYYRTCILTVRQNRLYDRNDEVLNFIQTFREYSIPSCGCWDYIWGVGPYDFWTLRCHLNFWCSCRLNSIVFSVILRHAAAFILLLFFDNIYIYIYIYIYVHLWRFKLFSVNYCYVLSIIIFWNYLQQLYFLSLLT